MSRNQSQGEQGCQVACMRGGGFTEYHHMHGNGNDSFLLSVISISGENIICLYPNKLNSRLGKPWGAMKMTEAISSFALRF